ncbi:extracellular solute-binding protein [Candidatus Izemoplasma sp. B36]|uniref:extracellular solute-binding protein n=1 Tax=Candidatus Izemoplasma sp. B36 TaxID=3242468 RepID=UPI003558A76E
MLEKLKQINKKWYILVLLILLLTFIFINFSSNYNIDYTSIDSESVTNNEYDELAYSYVMDTMDTTNQGVDVSIPASQISSNSVDGSQYAYTGEVVEVVENDVFSFNVNISEAGAYNIYFDQLDISNNILPNEISIKINGEFQYNEAEVINLTTYWLFESETFQLDRYGNEILPTSVKSTSWIYNNPLRDSTGLNSGNLLFEFNSGVNSIEIECLSGEFLLGNVYIKSYQTIKTYEEYLSLNSGEMVDSLITIGAENIYLKNDPSISLASEKDPSATSYDTKYSRLNAINGNSYKNGNDEIIYQITVPETGYYHLAFKYMQDYLMQMPVFREISIDGEVPFEDLAIYPFHYTTEYKNLVLNDGENEFKFYLTEGTHTLSLRVVLEPYRNAYENIIGVMEEINTLSLEIKKLTGNTSDIYRTWDLIDYIPDIEIRLDNWIEVLTNIVENLELYSHQRNPGLLTNIDIAINQLEDLREDVDDIPNKMVLLSDGSSSAAQFLGNIIQTFLENGMDIESIYVTDESLDNLPKTKADVFTSTWEKIKRFFLSFTADEYAVTDVPEGVIEVWVNHPRQYIEIMQAMIDKDFTPNSNIEVKLSVMPDENKLILANSTNYSPDIALGVNHWIPYEFAIRGASLDLRQFDGYEEFVGQFSPGVMIPYAFEEGIYGAPETQNFWVTFYRTDILETLDLEVPETWQEVIEILPELQRYGMNYYEPLALFKGFKPYVATIPFIYQFGGNLLAEDGMSTVINSEESLEGISLMSELFTVYNLPVEVPNFYNHFRYGTLPIGISDLSTYLQLTIAAPEIAGKWSITLHPGVLDEETGEISRWAASGAQASMILSNTEYPEESWDFLNWWMSASIQSEFAQRLQTTYGTAYLWNTANLEAFETLPIPTEDKQVILEQWEYAMEASRIPGSYMIEREISNAWNSIVFDDTNPRVTLDEAVKTANREILYKMEEFDYVIDGVIVKEYNVPTIYNISDWLTERDDND